MSVRTKRSLDHKEQQKSKRQAKILKGLDDKDDKEPENISTDLLISISPDSLASDDFVKALLVHISQFSIPGITVHCNPAEYELETDTHTFYFYLKLSDTKSDPSTPHNEPSHTNNTSSGAPTINNNAISTSSTNSNSTAKTATEFTTTKIHVTIPRSLTNNSSPPSSTSSSQSSSPLSSSGSTSVKSPVVASSAQPGAASLKDSGASEIAPRVKTLTKAATITSNSHQPVQQREQEDLLDFLSTDALSELIAEKPTKTLSKGKSLPELPTGNLKPNTATTTTVTSPTSVRPQLKKSSSNQKMDKLVKPTTGNASSPKLLNAARQLSLLIHKPREMPRTVDSSFVSVQISSETRVHKSSTISVDQQFVWAMEFKASNFAKSDIITIEVYDASLKKAPSILRNILFDTKNSPSASLLGTCVLKVEDLVMDPTPIELWLNLTGEREKDIAIKVVYTYLEVPLLPLESYSKFVKLLLSPDMRPLGLLESATLPSDRRSIADNLGHLFTQEKFWLPYLEYGIKFEVENCSQATTLFRGSSLSNTSLMNYLKLTGQSYLRQTLAPTIEEILTKKVSCDIRTEVKRDEFLNLFIFCKQLLNEVYASHFFMPPQIQHLLHLLRQKSAQKFGENRSMASVNALLFLRFIVPAIKSPREGITDLEIQQQEQKTLDLIANVVQKVANLQVFREGDSLTSMNPFIQENHGHVREFFERVTMPVSIEELEKSGHPIAIDTNLTVDCALLVAHMNTPSVKKIFKEKCTEQVELLYHEVETLVSSSTGKLGD